MSTIDRDSWHYKWMIGFLGFRKPQTICTYFWCLVWSLIGIPLLILMGTVCGLSLIFILLSPFHWWFTDVPFEFAFMIGAGEIGVLVVTLIIQIMGRRPYTGPSVLTQYIQAKKAKYCQVVQYR